MADCETDNYGYYHCYSAWYYWGRWLALSLIILGVLSVYFIFSCVTARKRRKAGVKPYLGTAWTLRHAPPEYTAEPPSDQNTQSLTSIPPPSYAPGRVEDVERGSKPNQTGL